MSHSRIVLSSPPDATLLLSGEKPTARTLPLCPRSVLGDQPHTFGAPASRHELRSHSFTVLSLLLEARILPSGENATALTPALCPRSVASSRFEATSHSFTVLSAPAEATVLPSGEIATPRTPWVCPRNVN